MSHKDPEVRKAYQRKWMRQYRLRHPDRVSLACTRYKTRHPNANSKATRKYYKKNASRWREHAATWRRENPELNRERKRKSYQKHIEKNRARSRQWKKDNPGRVAAHEATRRARKKIASLPPEKRH